LTKQDMKEVPMEIETVPAVPKEEKKEVPM
jgi:hypothetical protein